MKLSYSNEKDGGLSFETQWKIGFYHQKTVAKNAWKSPCLGEIPELHTCGYGHSQLIVWFVSVLSLTLPGLGFFENLRGLRGGPSRPVVKKHAVSQNVFVHFTWNFVHILYWQYGISLEKKLTNVTFVIIWWCHYESHDFHDDNIFWRFKFFRNWCIYFFFSQKELRRKCCIFCVSRFLINSQ